MWGGTCQVTTTGWSCATVFFQILWKWPKFHEKSETQWSKYSLGADILIFKAPGTSRSIEKSHYSYQWAMDINGEKSTIQIKAPLLHLTSPRHPWTSQNTIKHPIQISSVPQEQPSPLPITPLAVREAFIWSRVVRGTLGEMRLPDDIYVECQGFLWVPLEMHWVCLCWYGGVWVYFRVSDRIRGV